MIRIMIMITIIIIKIIIIIVAVATSANKTFPADIRKHIHKCQDLLLVSVNQNLNVTSLPSCTSPHHPFTPHLHTHPSSSPSFLFFRALPPLPKPHPSSALPFPFLLPYLCPSLPRSYPSLRYSPKAPLSQHLGLGRQGLGDVVFAVQLQGRVVLGVHDRLSVHLEEFEG